MMKLLRTKDKEQIWRAAREKQHLTYTNLNDVISHQKPRRPEEVEQYLSKAERKELSVKMPFKNEGQIKLSVEGKLNLSPADLS